MAAHHGSRHSTSTEFVKAAAPEFAVFSAGAHNRFGHPHPDALDRAAMGGAKIIRTDKDGAAQFTVGQDGIKITTWKKRGLRYWH